MCNSKIWSDHSSGSHLLIIAVFLVMIMSIACDDDDNPVNPVTTISASGTLVTEARTLDEFHSITIATAGQVNVTQGAQQSVSITVDDNLLQHVTLTSESGLLVIGLQADVQVSNMNLTVNVTMTDIESLSSLSAGSFTGVTTIDSDTLTLQTASAGSMSFEVTADRLNTSVLSAGSITLSGTADEHYAILASAGTLHAFELVTDTTMVGVNSVGNAEVNVTDLLTVTINSMGSVYFKGQPTIVQTVNGSGSVIDAN